MKKIHSTLKELYFSILFFQRKKKSIQFYLLLFLNKKNLNNYKFDFVKKKLSFDSININYENIINVYYRSKNKL